VPLARAWFERPDDFSAFESYFTGGLTGKSSIK
jgi:hypothetical protein